MKQTFRNFSDAALCIDSLLKPLRGLILNSCIFLFIDFFFAVYMKRKIILKVRNFFS